MPKKSKSAKSTSAATELNDGSKKATYEELIAQDPQFHRGSAKFKFPNGDEYDGEFCAHTSGAVWRQGRGTYTTNDGQIYVGDWDGDKLDETKEIEITYPDGTKYVGRLLKNKYWGAGIYQMEEKVSLVCNFIENKPVGDMILLDPNEKTWHGFAEKDECLLIPEHAFYRCIGQNLGKGQLRKKPLTNSKKSVSKASLKSIQKSELSASKSIKFNDIRDVEKQVFAKSKKTSSVLELGQSEWFQEYENYKNMFEPIVCKAKNSGETSLTAEEYDWYRNYKEFEKKCTVALNNWRNKTNKPLQHNKWFEVIHSEEYKINNMPIPVFYPREESDDCDLTCDC